MTHTTDDIHFDDNTSTTSD